MVKHDRSQGGGRAGNGRFARTADTAERDAKACELRTAGQTYDAIAVALGFSDPSPARRAVERGLAQIVAEPAAQLRTIELARLDTALREAWAVMSREHIMVNQGRVIMDPNTEQPMVDDGPTLAAIDRILKIAERRAKLLGLDAPTRVENITVDQIEAEMDKLAAEMGLTDPTAKYRS